MPFSPFPDTEPMATQADVRRIALSFPGTVEGKDRFAFSVMDRGKPRGFAWVWLERVAPKKPRVPQPLVLAVRVANLDEKDLLLQHHPGVLFTEPHYNGYPAVLVRLPKVSLPKLRSLLEDGWRSQAPKELAGIPLTRAPRGAGLSAERFRRMALALPGVTEGSHMGHADFRAGGKVFASLGAPGPWWGMVKVSSAEQAALIRAARGAMQPAAGAWGRSGSTLVYLSHAPVKLVQSALAAARKALDGSKPARPRTLHSSRP